MIGTLAKHGSMMKEQYRGPRHHARRAQSPMKQVRIQRKKKRMRRRLIARRNYAEAGNL